MKTWLVRAGWTLLALLILIALAIALLFVNGHRKAARHVEVRLEAVAARSDAAAIERGGYLFRSRGCTDCHGSDGAGRTFIDDGKGLRLRAPNITQRSAVLASYRMDDWDRAIRHGVAPGGRPLIIMPSEDYNRLTNDDFAALVAFLQQMPAAEGGAAQIELPLPVRVAYGAGLLKDAAEKIDHALPPSSPVPEAVSTAHGAYVANACIGCHGAGLSGGRIPGAPPDWPAAANLTPGQGSAMPRYADAKQFVSMMRSGRRADGSAVSGVMPFGALKEMSDVDLEALYLHLKGLAPRALGSH
ncbi:c-type cytochrome [Variovorax sp. YR752]|uniref:c-type cytochrome n=1 Tax=Variovorax sp. YR752 TaxID=1884383 RepID=UPI0031382958